MVRPDGKTAAAASAVDSRPEMVDSNSCWNHFGSPSVVDSFASPVDSAVDYSSSVAADCSLCSWVHFVAKELCNLLSRI